MENITFIDPLKDPRWDKFVEEHPYGWIVHLSGWKQLLENSFPHMKGYYLALVDDSNNEIRAALPLFEVKSWLIGNRLVSIPYATLCDPLISSERDFHIILENIMHLLKKTNASYIELRTLNSPSMILDNRLGNSSFYKHHYIELDKDPETLKKSFHRTNVRQRIQRAIESDVKIKVADSESDMFNYFTLHTKTRRKLYLPPQPYTFFKHLWEIFSPTKHLTLLLAEYKNQTIAGLILFKFRDRVSAEFLASNEEYMNVSPNHLLFWEAMKSAYSEGFKIFDFGRTSPMNESLMTFKSRWATKAVDLPQFYYPQEISKKFDNKEASASYKIIQKLCKNSPDPLYQLIGRFCYRHL